MPMVIDWLVTNPPYDDRRGIDGMTGTHAAVAGLERQPVTVAQCARSYQGASIGTPRLVAADWRMARVAGVTGETM